MIVITGVILLATVLHAEGLVIVNVVVPPTMVVGGSALLECHYAEETDRVYSVKWYLGLLEFYRWTPAETPQQKIFPIENAFRVDSATSTDSVVSIRNVTLSSVGTVRCEVSAEAPSFHTEYRDVNLTVVDVPDSRPVITVGRNNNQTKLAYSFVELNCSSQGAKPAARLSFFINEEVVSPHWLTLYPVEMDDRTEMETSTLGLRLQLLPRFLNQGYVIAKCIAELMGVYEEYSELLIAGKQPPRPSIMEGRASKSTPAPDIIGTAALSLLVLLPLTAYFNAH